MAGTWERAGKDDRNVWLTPPHIVKALGPFDLDPCYLPKEERPWDTAKNHFSEKENGLIQPWEGRVWLNPPYGRETPKWVKRMSEHSNGIVLVFARVETKWFHDYIWKHASAIFFPQGRIGFCFPSGECTKGSTAASCFASFDKYYHDMINANKLREFSQNFKGRYVDLWQT